MYEILYAADSNYFKLMITSIYSLLENNKDIMLNINIVEDNFTKEQKYKLEKLLSNYNNVKYKIYPIDFIKNYLDKFNVPLWRGTEVSNSRLFANEIVRNCEKLLYIDSDTIITNSIKEIFEDNSSYPISCSLELDIPPHIDGVLSKYYNSGVILFNFKSWDENHCSDKLYKTSYSHRDMLIYSDQDLINLSLNDSIKLLPFNYNISPKVNDVKKYPNMSKRISSIVDDELIKKINMDLNNPCIYHMLSYLTIRPWKKNNIHPFNKVFDEYFSVVNPDYTKESSDSIIAILPFVPILNLMCNAYIPRNLNKKTKGLIKKIINRTEL